MADPFSAVLQRLSRRDSTSLLIALLLGYSLAAFGVAATVTGLLRWLAAGSGVTAFVASLSAFGYSFVFARDRLRSEETVQMDMVLAWLSNPDVDDVQRRAAERLLPLITQTKSSKRPGMTFEEDGRD